MTDKDSNLTQEYIDQAIDLYNYYVYPRHRIDPGKDSKDFFLKFAKKDSEGNYSLRIPIPEKKSKIHTGAWIFTYENEIVELTECDEKDAKFDEIDTSETIDASETIEDPENHIPRESIDSFFNTESPTHPPELDIVEHISEAKRLINGMHGNNSTRRNMIEKLTSVHNQFDNMSLSNMYPHREENDATQSEVEYFKNRYNEMVKPEFQISTPKEVLDVVTNNQKLVGKDKDGNCEYIITLEISGRKSRTGETEILKTMTYDSVLRQRTFTLSSDQAKVIGNEYNKLTDEDGKVDPNDIDQIMIVFSNHGDGFGNTEPYDELVKHGYIDVNVSNFSVVKNITLRIYRNQVTFVDA